MASNYTIPAPRYKDVRPYIREALKNYIGKEFEVYGKAKEIAPGVRRSDARLIGVYNHCALFETTAGEEDACTTIFGTMFRNHAPIRFAPPLAVVAKCFKPKKVIGEPWDFFDSRLLRYEDEEEGDGE